MSTVSRKEASDNICTSKKIGIYNGTSTVSRSNWKFEMLVFVEGGKPETDVGKPSKQGR